MLKPLQKIEHLFIAVFGTWQASGLFEMLEPYEDVISALLATLVINFLLYGLEWVKKKRQDLNEDSKFSKTTLESGQDQILGSSAYKRSEDQK